MAANSSDDLCQIEPSVVKHESHKRKRDALEREQTELDLERQKIELESKKIQQTYARLDLLDKLVARYHDVAEDSSDKQQHIDDLMRAKVWDMMENA